MPGVCAGHLFSTLLYLLFLLDVSLLVMLKARMYHIRKAIADNFELIFWVTAMLALAISNPYQASHFELCPLKLMGISWCPGCGMGHSISFLFHGNIKASLHAHWLGIPALIIISRRILFLMPRFYIFKKT